MHYDYIACRIAQVFLLIVLGLGLSDLVQYVVG